MLTCVPLWAILVAQCGQSWAFYTQLTELPTYMSQILHFDIQQVNKLYDFVQYEKIRMFFQNALLSAVPYLTSWFAGILISILADWLLSKGYLSLSMSYKVFNSIGKSDKKVPRLFRKLKL